MNSDLTPEEMRRLSDRYEAEHGRVRAFAERPQFRPGKKARADALAEARKRIAELEAALAREDG